MWKKKVKAGILLYALLMVAIFSLLLSFYLNRQLATQRNLQLEREKVTAYAVASLSQKEAGNYNVGRSQVEEGKQTSKIEVSLQTGRTYVFDFPKKVEKKKEEEKNKVEEGLKEERPVIEQNQEMGSPNPTEEVKKPKKIESFTEK